MEQRHGVLAEKCVLEVWQNVCGGVFQKLCHVCQLPTIYSNQEETDTSVRLHLYYVAVLGYKNALVRTPDIDIFVIRLYHVHATTLTVYLDTGSWKQLVTLSDLAVSLGDDYSATFIEL